MADDSLRRDLNAIGGREVPMMTEAEQQIEVTSAMKLKAGVVLDSLRGAMLKPPFAADSDNAEDVWAIRLAPFDLDVLSTVVEEWISQPGTDFPSIGDMTTMATAATRRRDAERRGLDKRIPGQVCGRCGDSGYEAGPSFRVGEQPEEGPDNRVAYESVKPCSGCRAERRRAHDDGCDRAKHVATGGCPRCNPNTRRHAA